MAKQLNCSDVGFDCSAQRKIAQLNEVSTSPGQRAGFLGPQVPRSREELADGCTAGRRPVFLKMVRGATK